MYMYSIYMCVRVHLLYGKWILLKEKVLQACRFAKHRKKTVSVVSRAFLCTVLLCFTSFVVIFSWCFILNRVLMALCTHLGLGLITTPLSWRPSPLREAVFIISLTAQKRYSFSLALVCMGDFEVSQLSVTMYLVLCHVILCCVVLQCTLCCVLLLCCVVLCCLVLCYLVHWGV